MTPNQVVEHFGTQQKAADALGVTQSAVSWWVKNGYVPQLQQYRIEEITRKKLRREAA